MSKRVLQTKDILPPRQKANSPLEKWADKVVASMSKTYQKAIRTGNLPKVF